MGCQPLRPRMLVAHAASPVGAVLALLLPPRRWLALTSYLPVARRLGVRRSDWGCQPPPLEPGPVGRPGEGAPHQDASILPWRVSRCAGQISWRHGRVALASYLAWASLSELGCLTPPTCRPHAGSHTTSQHIAVDWFLSSAAGAWMCLGPAAPVCSRR